MRQARVRLRTGIRELQLRMFSKARSVRRLVTSRRRLTQSGKCFWKRRDSFTPYRAMQVRPGRRSSWRYCSPKKDSSSRPRLSSYSTVAAVYDRRFFLPTCHKTAGHRPPLQRENAAYAANLIFQCFTISSLNHPRLARSNTGLKSATTVSQM